MSFTPLKRLAELGQSIWYDNIDRTLLKNGELARLIQTDCVTGVTSNPTIFEKAIGNSDLYDLEFNALLQKNSKTPAKSLYEALAINDIRMAADLLRPVYDQTDGVDGYVSLEVAPNLAHDTEGSINEARRLFAAVGRPNVMIKIPGTEAGLPAITALISEGINVNVTLMFSVQHYENVVDAYLTGLEKLAANRGDLRMVASVASFFISRVDTMFDKTLETVSNAEALSLRGKIGIANAKAAYQNYEAVTNSKRFKALAKKGARPQRLLWASTGTKNPDYSDVLYIEELLGPNTVNTMPPATLKAFKEHGVAEVRLTQDIDNASEQLKQLDDFGIDYLDLTEILQTDGVNAFAKSFKDLMKTIEAKREALIEHNLA